MTDDLDQFDPSIFKHERTIRLTQYVLPDGRKQTVYAPVPEDVYKKAQAITELGHRFECEVLSTGDVSLTITGYDEDAGEYQDLAVKICPNGPGVQKTLNSMIMEFNVDD